MSHYYVGVDGGGTHTRVLVVNEGGRDLARAKGPASLVVPGRPEAAASVIADAVREALHDAGAPHPATALFAGVAGTGRETARSGLEKALEREGLADRVRVGNDVETCFQDAFHDGPGILVIAGTGSIAWGRGEDGTEARVGGWGNLIGDEGSAYSIGLECLRRVARSADGRAPDTVLRDAFMEHLGLERLEELVVWAHDATKADIARLVPVVVEASEEGDGVAGEVLVQAVEELEGHVLTLLDGLGPWKEPPRVALAGGLLAPRGPLRTATESVLRRHRLRPVDHEPDPVRGAVELSRKLVADPEGDD